MHSLTWLGQTAPMLDTPDIQQVGTVTLGTYGGYTQAGAKKNEDAALVWQDEQAAWTFAALLDAHGTSDSALLVLETLEAHKAELTGALDLPVAESFTQLERTLVAVLSSPDFTRACQSLQGETALLCCATKGAYLWWFSVGDCVAYLLHPELMRLGQYALNQRQFFEWVGKVNAFQQRPFTYSSGVRSLRTGQHDVLLLTDGLLEFGSRPFQAPDVLAAQICATDDRQANLLNLLQQVHKGQGRDSATVLHWQVVNEAAAPCPSA